MLPGPIYKSLPYLYIVAGLLCWLIIKSSIALIPAAVLVSTGLLVLWMRRSATQMPVYRAPEEDSVTEDDAHKIRFGERRFPGEDREFPIEDSNENMIAFNRRDEGERRKDEE